MEASRLEFYWFCVVWELSTKNKATREDMLYQRLVAYKKEHKHTMVPTKCTPRVVGKTSICAQSDMYTQLHDSLFLKHNLVVIIYITIQHVTIISPEKYYICEEDREIFLVYLPNTYFFY